MTAWGIGTSHESAPNVGGCVWGTNVKGMVLMGEVPMFGGEVTDGGVPEDHFETPRIQLRGGTVSTLDGGGGSRCEKRTTETNVKKVLTDSIRGNLKTKQGRFEAKASGQRGLYMQVVSVGTHKLNP